MVKSKALAILYELSVPNLATLNPIFYLSFSAGINPMNLMYAKYVSSLNLYPGPLSFSVFVYFRYGPG